MLAHHPLSLGAAPRAERIYSVRGVPVSFPHEPYPQQIELMESVLKALDSKQAGVFESPTGTGKTLALLCAALAWQQHVQDHKGVSVKIIYASRTHAQLEQVMREFKSTAYARRRSVVLLSSRESTCIEDTDVAQRKGVDQVSACRALTSKRRCQYKYNVDKRIFGSSEGRQLVDLEDLGRYVELRKNRLCPYFLARSPEVISAADLILTPYNYVLDPTARASLTSLDWSSTVVIFDEAHNIDSVCEEIAGFDLPSRLLSGAILDMDRLVRMRRDRGDSYAMEKKLRKPADLVLTLHEMLTVKRNIGLMKEGLDGYHKSLIEDESVTKKARKAEPGNVLLQVLGKAQLDDAELMWMLRSLHTLVGAEPTGLVSLDKLERLRACLYKLLVLGVDLVALAKKKKKSALELEDDYVFDDQELDEDWYGMYDKRKASMVVSESFRCLLESDEANHDIWVTHFWCFDAARVLRDLTALHVHSMLFASGTLSPVDSFTSTLGLTPNNTCVLENTHVVPTNRVLVGSVGRAASGKVIDCSFRTRMEAWPEVGDTILQICKIVPDGVLVYFASYTALQEATQCWHAAGVFSKLLEVKSATLVETRAVECDALLRSYDEAIASGRGAVLLAVCRGRLSEGMDFSDARARACILVGVPYPSATDSRVIAKRAFLDEGLPKTSGAAWYNQAAFRATNQAAGRVVRHANDFGAILLLDTRFDSFAAHLSKWFRPMFCRFEDAHRALAALKSFFAEFPSMVVVVPKVSVSRSGAAPQEPLVGKRPFHEDENQAFAAKRASVGFDALRKADAEAIQERKRLVAEQQQLKQNQSAAAASSFSIRSVSSGLRVGMASATQPMRQPSAGAPSLQPPRFVSTADRLAVHSGEAKLDASSFMILIAKALSPQEMNEFQAMLQRLKRDDQATVRGLRASMETLFRNVEGGSVLIARFLKSLPQSLQDKLR